MVAADAQSTPRPVPFPFPSDGSYRYHVIQMRGLPDITVDTTVAQSPNGLTLHSTGTYFIQRVVGMNTGPRQAPTPIFDSTQIDRATTLVLSPTLDVTAYSSTWRGAFVFFSRLSTSGRIDVTDAGATYTGFGLRKPAVVTLADNTTHFVVLDGWEMSTLLALPFELNAWKDAPVSVLQTSDNSVPHAVVSTVSRVAPDVRPKYLPAADVMVKLDGPDPVIEWFDPATLIPDLIELPTLRISIHRDGVKY